MRYGINLCLAFWVALIFAKIVGAINISWLILIWPLWFVAAFAIFMVVVLSISFVMVCVNHLKRQKEREKARKKILTKFR